jgi:hypothetical protein
MSNSSLVLNGIDGATGEYLLPSLTLQELARVARNEPLPIRWAHGIERLWPNPRYVVSETQAAPKDLEVGRLVSRWQWVADPFPAVG